MLISLRILLKNWKLTSIAVFSLSVAMAISIIGVSVFNAALLRPPASTEPDRLKTVYGSSRPADFGEISYQDYEYYRDHNPVFTGLAAYAESIWKNSAILGNRQEWVQWNSVSANYFTVMGMRPLMGRFFASGDDRNQTPSAVLTYFCWKRWGADPNIIGKQLMLGNVALTITGVAPSNFTGILFGLGADVIVPLQAGMTVTGHPSVLTDRNDRSLYLIGRLKPNVGAPQAPAAMQVLSRQLATAYPEADRGLIAYLTANTVLPPDSMADARLIAAATLGVILLVLLIACANVANLLLALAARRRQESMIRVAVGATRGRLIRQFLRESAILCAAAAIAGYFFASAALTKFSQFHASFPSVGDLQFSLNLGADLRVAGLILLLVFIATLAAGLAPALYASTPNLAAALGGEVVSGGAGKGLIRNTLVVIQVSVCTLVLAGTALCLRNLQNLRQVDPGFSARNLVAFTIYFRFNNLAEPQARATSEDFRQAALRVPGVESVCLAQGLPLDNDVDETEVYFTDAAGVTDKGVPIVSSTVDGNYFATLGIPLLAGRAFDSTDRERAPEVVVINHKMADTYWPGQNPIGKTIYIGKKKTKAAVAGVVRDEKYGDLDEPTRPFLYFAWSQHYREGMMLIARTKGDPRLWMEPLSHTARQLGLAVPIAPVTMEDMMYINLLGETLALDAIAALSALALLLAAVGLYGAIFFSVNERKKELGIRTALGALPSQLLGMVMKRTMFISGIGVSVGLFLGAGATMLFSSHLYGIHPVEWRVLAPVALGMVAITAAIAALAARPLLHVDPIEAVRHA